LVRREGLLPLLLGTPTGEPLLETVFVTRLERINLGQLQGAEMLPAPDAGPDHVLLVVVARFPANAAMLKDRVLEPVGQVALLRTGRDSWSGEDWRAFFDERAGIAEFDGGLPRLEAEARAYACCVAEWLNRKASPWTTDCRSERYRRRRPRVVAQRMLGTLA